VLRNTAFGNFFMPTAREAFNHYALQFWNTHVSRRPSEPFWNEWEYMKIGEQAAELAKTAEKEKKKSSAFETLQSGIM